MFTEFQEYAGATYRDADGPRDIHSLDYPYGGIVVEVLHAGEGVDRADLDRWVRDDYLPEVVGAPASGAAQSLRFVSRAAGDHRPVGPARPRRRADGAAGQQSSRSSRSSRRSWCPSGASPSPVPPGGSP